MQRPSYEPFDSQHNPHALPPYSNPGASGVASFQHTSYDQQHFSHQNAPPVFSNRFEVEQSVDNALSMLTNPDILNSLNSMVQQPSQQHTYSAPQQRPNHNSVYPPNSGPSIGNYPQRSNVQQYPPSHLLQGPGGAHDARGQMFDGGSGQHLHRATEAPPLHQMPQNMISGGSAAMAPRDAYPINVHGGHAPQQRPVPFTQPSRPDFRQPALDNRSRDYRGFEGESYAGHAAPMQNSRAEPELSLAMAHMHGGRDTAGGSVGYDPFNRRGATDFRQAPPDAIRGVGLPDAFGGPGGGGQLGGIRGPAIGSFRPGDYERAPVPSNYNYREMPAKDYRPGVGGDRADSRVDRGGGSLLDAYSSVQSRFGNSADGASTHTSRSGLGSSRSGGESLLDQYGGGATRIPGRDLERGVERGSSLRWDSRRSPSPSSTRARSSARYDAKFGLTGKAREPPAHIHSSRFERRRSRSPLDRLGGRGGSGRSPKGVRGSKFEEEVPPTKELFVGSIRDGTTEAHVLEAFSKFGPIDSLAIKANRHFGFVNFKNLSDAVRAKREMEGKPLATSIKLAIQFTKVDMRRGGDDGRPERRIEREPIQKELQNLPPVAEKERMLEQQDDASCSSPSQELGASQEHAALDEPIEREDPLNPESVHDEEERERTTDEVSAAGEHVSDS